MIESEESIEEETTEPTTEETTETVDPNKDKETLKNLMEGEGTGIDLHKEPEKFIENMQYLLDSVGERADNLLEGSRFLVGDQLYGEISRQLLSEDFHKIMVDLYRAQQNNQLDFLTYEQTREISKLVNKFMNCDIYIPTKDKHYFRNVMNDLSRAPENLEDILKEAKKGNWKLLPVGESLFHKQGSNDAIYNLKFVSVDYDENGEEFLYGYFEAVYSLENPNQEYTKDNPPKGILLDRDNDFINMVTYNYGNNSGVVHTLKDVAPYNILENLGNVGEEVKIVIPNGINSNIKILIQKEALDEVQENINNYIKEID